jgi:hypothetical protein
MGNNAVGANLVFARFSLPAAPPLIQKAGEYKIRPYLTTNCKGGPLS